MNLFEIIQNTKIILATNSPRRKELLTQLGIPFEVRSKEIDESYPKSFRPEAVAVYIAEKKANSFLKSLTDELLIAADTIVSIEDEIFGKPKDTHDAKMMLRKLSGKPHEVITGVALLYMQKIYSFYEKTTVHFKELTNAEIEYYIKEYQPFDKAGAYGIQEWIGMVGVTGIEGSYNNVVGLPTARLYHEIGSFLLQSKSTF
ncbi:Maf family protein [Albibacterium bauzanense]|uniref:dTTP/UTP pyrophosphatase n=1 Tax=Albibacterium bauzanense TaxID=653929 RepID=A0A4R1M2V3_9SPHI|nr:Maf family nucleotide pyrophosphatase [Albibacterium bauzanense]TCK85164.1 septum formation protein [Albibacterium bauzanense]